MQYGELLDIGRGLMEQAAPRALPSRAMRYLLRNIVSRPALFGPLLHIGQWFRPILPSVLRRHVPPKQDNTGTVPQEKLARKMLVLDGCVQVAATPRTNASAARVLHKLGISLVSVPSAGCCGAVNYHLGAHADGLDNMRRNIDAWWPDIESGAEAIVSTASGCGTTLADYGQLLAQDPQYAAKAKKVSELVRDISQILAAEDLSALTPQTGIGKVAVHTPCSLQHGLKLPHQITEILSKAGFQLAQTKDPHLCCGSAGTYSILQPEVSQRLRDKKLTALNGDQPAVIATANIGCQLQLQVEGGTPTVHWIELLDEELA